MDLIRYEEITPKEGFQFAPMIDFLFLMLSLFATIAISQTTLHDSEIDLVQKKEAHYTLFHKEHEEIHLSVTAQGEYRWKTEWNEYPMETLEEIQKEITRQHSTGILPEAKEKTDILLHIDKKTPWEPVAQLLCSIQGIGFKVYPVYEARD